MVSILNQSKQHSQKLNDLIKKNNQLNLEIKDQMKFHSNQTRQEVIHVLKGLTSFINNSKRESKNECDKATTLIKSKNYNLNCYIL